MLLSSKKKLSQGKNKIASAKTPMISFSVFQATWVQKGKGDERRSTIFPVQGFEMQIHVH